MKAQVHEVGVRLEERRGRSLVMVVEPRGRPPLAHYRFHYLDEMKRKYYLPLLEWMDRRKMNYRLGFGNWQEASE
jgi:hypothetical protein